MKLTYVICAVAMVVATGVQAQGMSMTMKPSSAASRAALPLVNAEVVRVDAGKGLIVLKHGEIPNLAMPPMTMGFDVADKKMLGGVKVGQQVKFHVEIVSGKPTITELKRAP